MSHEEFILFLKDKNGVHSITRILLRTCFNIPFLSLNLLMPNYLGLVILLLLSSVQKKKKTIQKESTTESNMLKGSEVQIEINMVTQCLV